MHLPLRIAIIFFFCFFIIAGILFYPQYFAERKKNADLAALLNQQKTLTLNERTKSNHCETKGGLPDHECTPGAVFPNADIQQVCTPGYSGSVRNVSQKLRRAVFAEYDIPYPPPQGVYEVDHLIPLSLGGNNDDVNLFPQAAEPAPGFREKDIVEAFLHEEVCGGRALLHAAQDAIAVNWLTIYQGLTPDQIEHIKNKYRNWSQ